MRRLRPLTTRLGATLHFPPLGFGTAAIGGLYAACSDAQAASAFAAAESVGCSYIDTAPLYGLGDSERRTGSALRGRASEGTRLGGATLPGRALLSTKVGRLLSPCAQGDRAGAGVFIGCPARAVTFDYSYDGVMRSFEASLERLGLERDAIDILFVHDLDVFTFGSAAAAGERRRAFFQAGGGYGAMEQLRAQGLVRAIGGGINEPDQAAALLRESDMDVMLLAGHYTLLGQSALDDLLPLCAARGAGVVLGGPFESGVLATGARGGADGVAYFKYKPASAEVLARTAALERVCAAHDVPLAAAALAFPLMHPVIKSVIPGGRSPDEVHRNAWTLNKRVPPALWEDLKREGLLRADAPTAAAAE